MAGLSLEQDRFFFCMIYGYTSLWVFELIYIHRYWSHARWNSHLGARCSCIDFWLVYLREIRTVIPLPAVALYLGFKVWLVMCPFCMFEMKWPPSRPPRYISQPWPELFISDEFCQKIEFRIYIYNVNMISELNPWPSDIKIRLIKSFRWLSLYQYRPGRWFPRGGEFH